MFRNLVGGLGCNGFADYLLTNGSFFFFYYSSIRAYCNKGELFLALGKH